MKKRTVPTIEVVERLHRAGVLGMASEVAHEHKMPFSEFVDGGKTRGNARAQFYRIIMTLKGYSAVEVADLFAIHQSAVSYLLKSYEISQKRKYGRLSRAAKRSVAA